MIPPSSRGETSDGCVVWITGLPSSGKSTLAERLQRRLRESARPAVVLDSDAVRQALVPIPGYDERGRDAFYATLSQLAAMLAEQGLVVLVPATAHKRVYRACARALAPRFVEVLVDTPAEECAARDAKGLYAAARAGAAPDLPGAGVAYERPDAPEITASGGHDDAALAQILALLS